jgi:hypothetical protein
MGLKVRKIIKVPKDNFPVVAKEYSSMMTVKTHRKLQDWTRATFDGGEMFLFTYEWMFPVHFVEKDPYFIEDLENPAKKFLEKNPKSKVLIRMVPLADAGFIEVVVFFLSRELNKTEIFHETWDLWDKVDLFQGIHHRHGKVDEYEFYVWAVPHPLSIPDVKFLGEMKRNPDLLQKLLSRVWEVKP